MSTQWSFRALSAVVLVVTGCASPPEEAEALEGDSLAVTVGSSFRSPLASGTYDGDRETLIVGSGIAQGDPTAQHLNFESDRLGACLADVDVSGGRATARSAGGCAIELTPLDAGRVIEIEGTGDNGHVYRGRFTRRKKNALVGSYGNEQNRVEARVTASSDSDFTFDLTADGKSLAKGTRAKTPFLTDFTTTNGCALTAFVSPTGDGRYEIFVASSTDSDNPAFCALLEIGRLTTSTAR